MPPLNSPHWLAGAFTLRSAVNYAVDSRVSRSTLNGFGVNHASGFVISKKPKFAKEIAVKSAMVSAIF